VDLKRFAPGTFALQGNWVFPDGALLFASIGTPYPAKGHVYLLQALAAVRRRPIDHLSNRWRRSLRGALEVQMRALGLDEACRFLGDVPDIETVFAAADVTVLSPLEECERRARGLWRQGAP